MFEININGTNINLPCNIKKSLFKHEPIIRHNEKYIVLITENCKKDGRNVFLFNKDGELMWQIPQETVNRYIWNKNEKFPSIINTYFVDARFTEDGQLKLWNTDGFIIYLDPKNGKVISDEFAK